MAFDYIKKNGFLIFRNGIWHLCQQQYLIIRFCPSKVIQDVSCIFVNISCSTLIALIPPTAHPLTHCIILFQDIYQEKRFDRLSSYILIYILFSGTLFKVLKSEHICIMYALCDFACCRPCRSCSNMSTGSPYLIN